MLALGTRKCNATRWKPPERSVDTFVAHLRTRPCEQEWTMRRIEGRPIGFPQHMQESAEAMQGEYAIETNIIRWDANVSCFQFHPLDARLNGGGDDPFPRGMVNRSCDLHHNQVFDEWAWVVPPQV